ncbi:MAG: hypothetical protein H0U28_05940 [Nocardioidaceae bacterium]|nr:hypothetical protein [Nocardioidaceae bacterium]
MSRRVAAVDRISAVLVGLALVAGGLLAIDWHHQIVLDLAQTVSAPDLPPTTDLEWWPWATGGAGLVLLLLALGWLWGHAPKGASPVVRLPSHQGRGQLSADLSSVASAAADAFQARAPVSGCRGAVHATRFGRMVDVTGHLEPHADLATVLEGASQTQREVTTAFPSGTVSCRVILNTPRTLRRGDRAGQTPRVR